MKIRSNKLTTCSVANDGSALSMEFLDQSGSPVTVEFPLDQAEALVMTIPQLLARAVKWQTGNDDARYVFGLEGWRIEAVKDRQCLIATLLTSDGFEVSFAITFEACHSLAWNLRHSADQAVAAGDTVEGPILGPAAKLN